MKPTIFLLLLLCISASLKAQLSDDFSDGNFTDNPTWFGNTDRFSVTNAELQLTDGAPASNNIASLYLPAATSLEDSTTWECYVRMAFATSTSNYSRIYLSASNSDLTGAQNGYYLRIGGISGSTDAVELFRQDGTTSTLVLSGVASGVGGDPVAARLRVTRNTAGQWTLWADYSGGTNFQMEASAQDATYNFGQYFGVVCYYTSTRAQSFFFDDVRIEPIFTDMQPPVLLMAQATSATTVIASFNEPLDPASASDVNNFQVSGIGLPLSATPVAGDPASVELELPTPMTNLQTYMLNTNMVADAIGNESGVQMINFTYVNVQAAALNDVIITEIMADPTPVVALPDAEYIELYNRSNKVIQLSSLSFIESGAAHILPSYLLMPGTYVTVCDDEVLATLSAFGAAVSLSTFPSLTNGGEPLSLANTGGSTIFEVAYSDSWYTDLIKMAGGWSLEMIDPANVNAYNCPGNWRASENSNGGTPGQQNSLQGAALEQVPPALLRAVAESPSEILLVFTEPLSPASAEAVSNYAIDNGLAIISAALQVPARIEVLLTLSGALQSGIVYTVTARSGQKDCIGNTSTMDVAVKLGLAEAVSPGDVVINEVLFYPETSGSDFLELYNRSDKIFNIAGWQIVNAQKLTGSMEATVAADFLLFPQEYVVLTPSAANISANYEVANIAALIQNSLPTLDSDVGNVTIRVQGVTIDSFDYDDDMHYALLSDKRGVSLERLSPELPTQDRGNWHSAASSAGYATPTARNSQLLPEAPVGPELVSLTNKTFSPDGDGEEDVLSITYAVDQPGYTINIKVFDASGRQVRDLVRNELLATEGIYKWDGTTDDSSRARIGIYVLWIELFNPNGQVERMKKTCVLAGRF